MRNFGLPVVGLLLAGCGGGGAPGSVGGTFSAADLPATKASLPVSAVNGLGEVYADTLSLRRISADEIEVSWTRSDGGLVRTRTLVRQSDGSFLEDASRNQELDFASRLPGGPAANDVIFGTFVDLGSTYPRTQAFVVGNPTSSTDLPSGEVTYSGVTKTTDGLTGSINLAVDFGAGAMSGGSMTSVAAFAPDALVTIAPAPLTSDGFATTLSSADSDIRGGVLQGNVFGPSGSEVAGTFAIDGIYPSPDVAGHFSAGR